MSPRLSLPLAERWSPARARPLASRLTPLAALLALTISSIPGSHTSVAEETRAQEGADRASHARERLLELQEKLRSRRAEAQLRRRSQEERARELASEKRSVERTTAALEEQRQKLESALEKRQQHLDQLTTRIESSRERDSKLLAALGRYARRVARLVDEGIPWNLNGRKQSVADLETTLTTKDISPAAALGAIGRVQKEEEALARLVEKDVVEVSSGDETIAVQAFHLGLLGVVFANDTGEAVGFASAGQTLEAGLDALAGQDAATDGYLRAVEILSRQRTPQLIGIWFPTLPVASDERREREGEGR